MKKVAYIFPGQGSQTIGMAKDFYDNLDIARELIESASDRLKVDFKKLMFEPNDDLEKTQFTQSAILLTSMIAHSAFVKNIKQNPVFALGHSLGEFSAVSAVGAIDIIDAVELVYNRGLLMQKACEDKNAGMMVVLGLDDAVVEQVVYDARTKAFNVWAANYNSDGQIVLAGTKDDLAKLEPELKAKGAKRAMLLAMSVASHCPLQDYAKNEIAPLLEKFIGDSFISPVISNVNEQKYNSKKDALKLLQEQLVLPVRYKQSIAKFDNEVDFYIEFGNGSVLKGLNKKLSTKETYSVNSIQTLNDVLGLF